MQLQLTQLQLMQIRRDDRAQDSSRHCAWYFPGT
jgi:hypothetical protein